jgi:hypothetical protein
MAAVRNVLMGKAIVCVQSNALAHGQSAKQTAAIRCIPSPWLRLVSELSVQQTLEILSRAPLAKASARRLLIAKASGKHAVLLARQHPSEFGARYGRSLAQEQLAQNRQTVNTAKGRAKHRLTAWVHGPSARPIAITSGSRYQFGHLQAGKAVWQEMVIPPGAHQVKELARRMLIAKENGPAVRGIARQLRRESGRLLLKNQAEVGTVPRAQTAEMGTDCASHRSTAKAIFRRALQPVKADLRGAGLRRWPLLDLPVFPAHFRQTALVVRATAARLLTALGGGQHAQQSASATTLCPCPQLMADNRVSSAMASRRTA